MWLRFRLSVIAIGWKPKSRSEKHLCLIAPLRNIEPEESVGLFSQGRQLGQVVVAHAVGVDPAQLAWRVSLPRCFYTTPQPLHAGHKRPPSAEGAALSSASLVLRPGRDGAFLVPDLAYPRAFTLRVGRTDQSYVDLDDPLRLEFDYVQRLADVLDSVAEPGQRLRVVHVGGAAMTLPRYVAATRPSSAQIVLEPDVELTAFVRRHLPLPARSGIKVRGTDGRRGIAELRDGYADLVIIDAFVGARVPAELTTAGIPRRCSAGLFPIME